jgi:hypothetical protein
VTRGEPVRWGDLHPGDVVEGRDGLAWTVRFRAHEQGSRWLSRAGDRHDLFELTCEDGRTVKAGRPLGDVVPLRSRAPESELASSARAALVEVFGDVTLIREGSPVSEPTTIVAPVNACRHDPELTSVLRDGRRYCTGCFETLTEPPADALEIAAQTGEALPAPAPAPRMGVDATGVEWEIPATHDDAAACAAGVHPLDLVTPFRADGNMLGCSGCGLVLPRPVPVGETAPVVLSQPVDSVIVVNEPAPAAPVDEFLDPAPKPEPGDAGLIKNKRYWLPHPETGVMTSFTRASTLSKILSSTYLLDQWELREVAYGVAVSPDLIALAASVARNDNPLDRAEAKATLSEVVRRAKQRAKMDARANLGTALHAFTHRRARGESIEQLRIPAELLPDLHAYEVGLRMHGLTEVPDLVERTVVSTRLGVAGTFDRIVHQRGTSTNPNPVPYTVLDLKTGRTLEFSLLEFAIQLAIYAHADYLYDKATGTYQPFPGPEVLDRTRALVMHLPVGEAKATVWALDIARGWEYAEVAEKARQGRNAAEGFGWLCQPDPETLLIHRVSKAASTAELAQLWEVHNKAGQWSDAVNDAAMDRAAALAAVV